MSDEDREAIHKAVRQAMWNLNDPDEIRAEVEAALKSMGITTL